MKHLPFGLPESESKRKRGRAGRRKNQREVGDVHIALNHLERLHEVAKILSMKSERS